MYYQPAMVQTGQPIVVGQQAMPGQPYSPGSYGGQAPQPIQPMIQPTMSINHMSNPAKY
jgi:hypothetical protein